ncbi:MAG: DUF2254 domain-containing protein [Pedococcus sp.]
MNLLQRLTERFWFLPTAMCVVAVILAESLVYVDGTDAVDSLPSWVANLVYRVGESGSRDILGAIASASLGVAGTTFSITMAVLALTSSSYGPRLVRNFMADKGNQVVLGVYVSTFLYSLLVLRSIRDVGALDSSSSQPFVPHLAVNGAVLLAVANVAVLVYFIHHISDSIQISTLSGRVRIDLLETVDRLYAATEGEQAPRSSTHTRGRPSSEPDASAFAVRADGAGYVQSIDDEQVVGLATRHDLVVWMSVQPGDHLLPDTALMRVEPTVLDDEVAADLRGCVLVGDARSPFQDVAFAAQQLTELAVRALSPGTNDPYTAINALDDLGVGLSTMAALPRPTDWRSAEDGSARLHWRHPTVETVVAAVVDSMRWYAASAPSVMSATLRLVERVGMAGDDQLRSDLRTQVDRLAESFDRADHQPCDNQAFAALIAASRSRLALA